MPSPCPGSTIVLLASIGRGAAAGPVRPSTPRFFLELAHEGHWASIGALTGWGEQRRVEKPYDPGMTAGGLVSLSIVPMAGLAELLFSFSQSLGDEQPIERVVVRDVQLPCEPGVVDADCQFVQALFGDHGREIIGQKRRARQLAQAELGGDVHSQNRANQDWVVIVGDGLARTGTECGVIRKPR